LKGCKRRESAGRDLLKANPPEGIGWYEKKKGSLILEVKKPLGISYSFEQFTFRHIYCSLDSIFRFG